MPTLLDGKNRTPTILAQMVAALQKARMIPMTIPQRDRLQRVVDDGCKPFCKCNGYNDGQSAVFCRVCQKGFHVSCV